MFNVLITALGTSLFVVRITKGSWFRNPAYVALAIFGGIASLLILMRAVPGAEESFIYGNRAAFAGATGAIMIYDMRTELRPGITCTSSRIITKERPLDRPVEKLWAKPDGHSSGKLKSIYSQNKTHEDGDKACAVSKQGHAAHVPKNEEYKCPLTP